MTAIKIDPIGATKADHIVQADVGQPDLNIEAGDFLFVKATDTAEPGQLVVANIDGKYAPRRHDGELEIHGRVVGLFRRFGDG